jgi:hypothetical protein
MKSINNINVLAVILTFVGPEGNTDFRKYFKQP